MHSDGKKRRSFVALLLATDNLQRYPKRALGFFILLFVTALTFCFGEIGNTTQFWVNTIT
jgi:hypothetical protein